MLHRSFKAGKCKTSLKLAMARIKLLKNKREAQLKQMKKELAQLLESGQERTARIRVEHVVMEEKTITAYDLIEIYCELIAARLPIIESQKNCPIDLKEAVASVVFASPRCSDIPELSDVRKHVTAKYGKEFIASALELRPECGVNRMMVEKLSAIAPDGETKIKLLTLIAQEHKIKWDPKEFAEKESKPPEDLLNGPRISEAASNAPAANPTVQLPHRHDPKYESSVNSETKVAESARSSQNFEHTYSTTRTSHPEPRSSVYAAEGRASVTSPSKEESSFSLNRQNWGMEFKDATSAAQAAAESAERASIAARAAAELSSIGRIRQQNSMGSQESFGNSYSDDGIKKSRGPTSKTEHIEHSVKMDDLLRTSSHGMDSRMQDERRHKNGKENLAGASASSFDVDSITDRRDSRSTQLGSKISFPDDDILLNNLPQADVYSQRSTFEVDATNSNWQTDKTEKGDFLGEVCMEKQSSEFVVESQDLQQNWQRIEHNSFGKVGISKPHDRSASISDGSASDDDVMLDSELRMNESGVSGHSSSIGQGNVQIGAKQPSFSNYAAAVFDDSGSDDDCNLAAESVFSHHEFDFYEPSEDRKSLSHISEHSGSPRRQGSGSLGNSSMQSHFAIDPHSPFGYAESTKEAAVPSRLSVLSATFDDSDGLYSDSDEENVNNAKLGGRTDISSRPLEHTALTRSPESLQTDRVQGPIKYTSKKTEATDSYQKPRLHSSSDYLESYDVHSESNLEAKPNVGGPAQEKQEHLESSSLSRLSLAEEVKATDDFRYTVSSKNSPVVEEKRQPLSQLSFTKELKLKDDVNAQGVPDNMEDSYISQTLSSESGQGLNFGRLSGGFRNKGYIRPPYNKGPSSDASSQSREKSDGGTSAIKEKPTSRSVLGTSMNSGGLYQEPYNQKQVEVQRETSSRTPKTIFDSPSHNESEAATPYQTSMNSGALYQEPNNQKKQVEVQHETSSRTPKTIFHSDSDNESEVASPYQTSMNSGALYQEPYNQKKQVEVLQHETSSRTPKTIFDSDSDNKTEVVSPYQTVGNSGYSRRGLSQRTRDSAKQSQANSLPRFSSGSQVQASSERRKPSTSASYDTKSVSGPPTEKARYESSGESSLRSSTSEEHSKAQNQVRNKQNSMLSTADTSVLQKTNKAQTQNKVQVYDEGSELSQPSSIVKEPSLLHSSAASRETIPPKSPSLSKALGFRENSLNKASHVHPKLPDYDSFAAHFESLRSNRRSG